ncbi:hypothetical protein ACTFIW_004891 [Dictyostelium discoideum]
MNNLIKRSFILNYSNNINPLLIRSFTKKNNVQRKFPTTMLKLKKKISLDLKQKEEEIEKKIENLLIKEEEIEIKKQEKKDNLLLKKQQQQENKNNNNNNNINNNNNNYNNILIGFGKNNLRGDSFLEKEKEISNKQKEISDKQKEKEKLEKRKENIKLMKSEYLEKIKTDMEKRKRLNLYNRLKSNQENITKNRLLNKQKSETLSMVGRNKSEPFERSLENSEEKVIKKFRDQKDPLSFQDRIDLHLHSFQIHLKNNLFKSNYPMIYNNLNGLILSESNMELIEKSVEEENYYKIIEMARPLYQNRHFKEGNLVYKYTFQYMKRKSKLWKFFQQLENKAFNRQIDPLDFSEMIKVFLELDQINSAEMISSNMQSFFQNFHPDVFIHFFEYYNRQPGATVSSVTSEFLTTFKTNSYDEKEVKSFEFDNIKKKRELFFKENEKDNEKETKNEKNDDEEKNEKQLYGKLAKDDQYKDAPIRNIEMFKSILIHCYKNGYVEFAENLEAFMEEEGVLLDLEMFNSKLKLQAYQCRMVDEIFLNSGDFIIPPTLDSTTKTTGKTKKNQKKLKTEFMGNSQTFLAINYHQLIVKKDIEDSFSVLNRLKNQWSFKLNTFILNQLIFGLSRLNEIDKAIKYYKMIPTSTNGIQSKIMNQSVLLYTMAYFNYPSSALISFIKDNNNIIGTGSGDGLFDKVTLDLILYGYLLDNKFKQDQHMKFIKQQQNNDNDNNNNNIKINYTNMLDNLLQVLNYLKSERLITKLDKDSIDFIFSRLLLLKNNYNIKPSPTEFKLLKQLIK